MQPRRNSFLLAFAMVSASYAGAHAGQGKAVFADGYITGYHAFHFTSTPEGSHFLLIHAPGSEIHLVSTKRRLEATCAQAEGNIKNKMLVDATLTGGVHAVIERPSAGKGGSGTQTATADGSKAIYSEMNNSLDLEDSVVFHDSDPGASRDFKATGSSAHVILSPQGSEGEAFRSVVLERPVVMDLKGTRADSGKRVPTSIHATSDHATFDNIRHIVVLEGHVHVISDDPNMPGEESGIVKETITLNPDGSINSVDGGGSPGATTLNTGTFKNP